MLETRTYSSCFMTSCVSVCQRVSPRGEVPVNRNQLVLLLSFYVLKDSKADRQARHELNRILPSN